MHYVKHTLNNGLRVILIPMKDTQTVTVSILVEAGSKYENKQNNGISHFLEHMMFKGTKKRPKSKIITEELDSIGGEYNAFTGKEQTGYWVKVAKQHLPVALDVVSDLYLNSLLDEKEINRERGVILQEAAMYRDTPQRYVWDIFESLLYGDQPAGWDIIGTEENIKRFGRQDFVDYFQKMYIPQSTVVVVAGNFADEKTFGQIQKIFGADDENKKTPKKAVRELQTKPGVSIFKKDTDQTHLIIGLRSANMFSPERYATVLLGTVLGGGMSSRMFHNIRERHGLTYYIDAASEQMTDTGYLFTRAGVEIKNVEKTIKLILNEYNKIKEKPVSQKELRKAKEYIRGKTLMSLESSSSVAHFFGDQELFKKEVKTPTEILNEIEAVTADDIQEVAKQIFTSEKLNLSLIGPVDNEDKLTSILNL